MMVYCEATSCYWCTDGICQRDSVSIKQVDEYEPYCEDYMEYEEECA